MSDLGCRGSSHEWTNKRGEPHVKGTPMFDEKKILENPDVVDIQWRNGVIVGYKEIPNHDALLAEQGRRQDEYAESLRRRDAILGGNNLAPILALVAIFLAMVSLAIGSAT